jgi:hypothetical protein
MIGMYSLIWAIVLGGVTWVLVWFFIERVVQKPVE